MSMSYSHKIDHFLPYGKQTISEADIEAVVRVLRSPYLTQGPAVPAFSGHCLTTLALILLLQ